MSSSDPGHIPYYSLAPPSSSTVVGLGGSSGKVVTPLEPPVPPASQEAEKVQKVPPDCAVK